MSRAVANVTQAAKLSGMSRRTIYNWIAQGKVDYIRSASGAIRIYVDTLWRDSANQRMSPHSEEPRQARGFL